MIYLIVGITLLILLAGFIFTESNASYLLRGYSRRGDGADFSAEVRHFRNFHVVLALSFAIFGTAIQHLFDENITGIFIVAYPILGYTWFIISLRKGRSATISVYATVVVGGLVISLLLAGGVLYRGLSPNKLNLKKNELVVTGVYGMRMNYNDIVEIAIVDTLPQIRKKIHGYVNGAILKGEFRLESGDRAKIIVDKRYPPFVKIAAADGRLFYITDENIPSTELAEKLNDVVKYK